MTGRDKTAIRQAIAELQSDAQTLLCDLIALPSLSGQEAAAVHRMAQAFAGSAAAGYTVELRPISNRICEDADYSFPEAGLDYTGRHNLVVTRRGAGNGRSALLQTHLDVVPAGEWAEAFQPAVREGYVYGRGACDCKGQAVTLWLAMAALNAAGVRLGGDLTAQFVIEEEIGGNGALALVLDGDRADAAVILEPTGMQIHPACRGAFWFRIVVTGESVHMGRKQEGISAFERTLPLFPALAAYEQRLIAESRNQPLFERYPHPVQVNVGVVRAGEWPSMVPGTCVVEGGIGFLPNKPMRQVQEELREVLASASPELAAHATLDFPKLHNDAYACDPLHPAVTTLQAACHEVGLGSDIFGWNVSCDARLYALRGGMPAVVFGPGDVADAHSDHERIRMAEMAQAAEALVEWLVTWGKDEG